MRQQPSFKLLVPTIIFCPSVFCVFLVAASIPNKYPENPLGNRSFKAATAVAVEDIDLKVHSKLESQKIPKEMLQSPNNKEQNGSTIILTPTSLTTAATLPPAGGQSGNNGGGGGGCVGDSEYKGPAM